MKDIILILTLAFLMSMTMASASEIEITSPVAGQKYFVWDEIPIEFTSMLGEGYAYTTYVNGVVTNSFEPKKGGRYVIKVLGEDPDCEECFAYYAERTINIGNFPRPEQTRINIIAPVFGAEYFVNDTVPIQFESPLTDRATSFSKSMSPGRTGHAN